MSKISQHMDPQGNKYLVLQGSDGRQYKISCFTEVMECKDIGPEVTPKIRLPETPNQKSFQPGHIRGEDQIEALVDALHDQFVLALKAPGNSRYGSVNTVVGGKTVTLTFSIE